jgi:hypothetical protein
MALQHQVYLVSSCVVCHHLLALAPLGQRLIVCANEKSILVFFNYDRVKGYVPNQLGFVRGSE